MYITKLLNKDPEAQRILYHFSKAFGYKAFDKETPHNNWRDRLAMGMSMAMDYIDKNCTKQQEETFNLRGNLIKAAIEFSSADVEPPLENVVFDTFLEIVGTIMEKDIKYHLLYGEDAIIGISCDCRFLDENGNFSKRKYFAYLAARGYGKDDLSSSLVEVEFRNKA